MKLSQTGFHQLLECGCHISQSKWHPFTVLKSKSPTVKAVSGILSSSNSTCQYPALRSNGVNHQAPFKQSKVSVISGKL